MFIWAGCVDGSSIDLNKIDAFIVGEVPKHDTEGNPVLDSENNQVKTLCVFAVLGANNYPIRVVDSMRDAQITIQSILGNLKKEYDKEHNSVQVATHEEKASLKLGK